MDREKRKDNAPIPDNLAEVLNQSQRNTLPGLNYSGWESCFLRMRMFLDPEIVLCNRNDNRPVVLEYVSASEQKLISRYAMRTNRLGPH